MVKRKFNYFNYYTEIEEYFVKRRGRHILLSPMDWSLIKTWKELGVPLAIALRGIDVAVRKFEAKKSRYKFINSLFYCHQSVMEEYEGYLASMAGSAEEENISSKEEPEKEMSRAEDLSEDQIEYTVQTLIDMLIRRKRELVALSKEQFVSLSAVTERLIPRLDEIIAIIESKGSVIDVQKVQRDIEKIDEILIGVLREVITKDVLKDIRMQCRRELKHYKNTVSDDIYKKIFTNLEAKKIMEYYKISDLSFLGI